MAVACGEKHIIAIDKNGHLFGFGDARFGQLGNGLAGKYERIDVKMPVGIDVPVPVRQVATEEMHTGIVTEAGDLLMCGEGCYGKLGLGDSDDRKTPTLVPRTVFDGKAVLMVACGRKHTATLIEGGGVYTFGCGEHGQLGHGDDYKRMVPTQVPMAMFNGERIVMVATGRQHTVALSEAGHVFTWGRADHGQLGYGDTRDRLVPTLVDARQFGNEKVVFVAAGEDSTVAVTAGGQLFTWGNGVDGQLGHGSKYMCHVPTLVRTFGVAEGMQVVMAACKGGHALVLTEDGALWACGSGYYGQLGLNSRADRHVFERVGAGAFGGARVVTVAAGRHHSAAVTEDGALWTWGCADNGQLGIDPRIRTIDIPSPISVNHFTRTIDIPTRVSIGHLQRWMTEEEKKAFRESSRGRRLFVELHNLIISHRENMQRSAQVKVDKPLYDQKVMKLL